MAPKEALVPCHRRSVRRAIVDDRERASSDLWQTIPLSFTYNKYRSSVDEVCTNAETAVAIVSRVSGESRRDSPLIGPLR